MAYKIQFLFWTAPQTRHTEKTQDYHWNKYTQQQGGEVSTDPFSSGIPEFYPVLRMALCEISQDNRFICSYCIFELFQITYLGTGNKRVHCDIMKSFYEKINEFVLW